MSFGESIRVCLREKFTAFDGRATRSEFWWFYLFVNLAVLALSLPVMLFAVIAAAAGDGAGATFFWILTTLMAVALVVVAVGLYIPFLAVGSRRLHDRGQSGWFQLLLLVPCGAYVLIVLWVLEGTPGPNAYGPQPS